ncbi:MAG: mannose-1-phosphate guanylyltransferase/mannose-6-phosphate isomerase [Actinomycetota bacterium]|nr:mannose-1-phosphate guanylyltransferase/mannose-6-phosphate isomerase [Actinomycetota bacterium]
MTDRPIVPVILSGGAGSRLWPASRSRQPKQLLSLVEERTMLLMTIQRTDAVRVAKEPVIVCNEDQRVGIERELMKAGYPDAPIILEPIGRNTAPATAVAALQLTANGDDPILFVMPADHVIRNEQAFSDAVDLAAGIAEEGYLLTFGIDPTGPETGYGYIRFGDRLAEGVRVVDDFREKPDAATAEEYIASGRYLWNSGIFMFRASRFLAEVETHAPDVLRAARAALANAEHDGSAIRLGEAAFASAPSLSIDYAVMEHTTSAAVVPIHTGWSDVGSWTALWDLGQHDEDGNVVIGDVETIDVQNSYVRSNGRLVAAIGLDNVVIVDTPDATLVSRRDRSQDVKAIVDRLKAQDRPEVHTDGSEVRTWGGFTTLDSESGHRVLRLRLNPGAEMPIQTHEHQSEHWIVVSGNARVRIGDETHLTAAGEAISIPSGAAHQIHNASETSPLEIIKVNVTPNFEEEEG